MDRYLTELEAAKVMGVSRRTVEYLRSKRQGPPVTRIGERMIRYSEAALRMWLASKTESNTAPGGATGAVSEVSPPTVTASASWHPRTSTRGMFGS